MQTREKEDLEETVNNLKRALVEAGPDFRDVQVVVPTVSACTARQPAAFTLPKRATLAETSRSQSCPCLAFTLPLGILTLIFVRVAGRRGGGVVPHRVPRQEVLGAPPAWHPSRPGHPRQGQHERSDLSRHSSKKVFPRLRRLVNTSTLQLAGPSRGFRCRLLA